MAKRNNSFSKDKNRAKRRINAPRESKQIPMKAIVIALIAVLAVAVIVGAVFGISAFAKYRNEVVEIYIDKMPTDREYYVGDKPDYNGLVLGLVKRNGETEYISYTSDPSAFSFSGFDSSAPVTGKPIMVFYQDFSAIYYVSVEEVPKPTPLLTGITLETLPKTEYTVDEWLDAKNGVILCEYGDGSVLRVSMSNNYVYGFEAAMDQATTQQQRTCEYTLTVKYVENGILAETTYTINITNPNIAEQ